MTKEQERQELVSGSLSGGQKGGDLADRLMIGRHIELALAQLEGLDAELGQGQGSPTR